MNSLHRAFSSIQGSLGEKGLAISAYHYPSHRPGLRRPTQSYQLVLLLLTEYVMTQALFTFRYEIWVLTYLNGLAYKAGSWADKCKHLIPSSINSNFANSNILHQYFPQ